jgi:hypothetical protein
MLNALPFGAKVVDYDIFAEYNHNEYGNPHGQYILRTPGVISVGASSNVYTFDLSEGENFTFTTGDTVAKSIEFSNVPSDANIVIKICARLRFVNAVTINFPDSVKWEGGTAPTFEIGNEYLLTFVTYDNGITWLARTTQGWQTIDLSVNMVVNGDFEQGQTGWTIEAGTWDFSTGQAVLTVSATDYYYIESDPITVLPNTAYEFFGDNPNGSLHIVEKNGSSDVKFNDYTTTLTQPVTITTQAATTSIVLRCSKYAGSGTYTFDNISLKISN